MNPSRDVVLRMEGNQLGLRLSSERILIHDFKMHSLRQKELNLFGISQSRQSSPSRERLRVGSYPQLEPENGYKIVQVPVCLQGLVPCFNVLEVESRFSLWKQRGPFRAGNSLGDLKMLR